MATLKVTARGQVTFRKEILKHLGIPPGGKIKLDLLPNGQAAVSADKPAGSWTDLCGFLDDKTNGARLSIDDINDATAEAASAAAMPDRDQS